MPIKRRRTAEIESATMLSASVRSLVLRLADGEPISFVAGQYVDLLVPTQSGLMYRRPYSIASPPEPTTRPGRVEVAVTRVAGGSTSEALHELAVGARIALEGPAGVFVRRDASGDPLLFVATGTGLAPIRAMLACELARESEREITLLFGCRSERDVLWGDELRSWSERRAGFRFEVSLSQGSPGWPGRRGYVQRHVRELAQPLGRGHAYVCGLSPMVDDVTRILEAQLSWPHERVHYEAYDR
jgi:CDP-4-dehydro-6-deoxyglucose reductase